MDGARQKPGFDDPTALVVKLQVTVNRLLTGIERLELENAELKVRVAELEAENAELWKKYPTQRLAKSYSMTAEEKRREAAETRKPGMAKKHGLCWNCRASHFPVFKTNTEPGGRLVKLCLAGC